MQFRLGTFWSWMEGQRARYAAALAAMIAATGFMYLVPLVPQAVIDVVLMPRMDERDARTVSSRVIDLLGGREWLSGRLWIAALAIILLTSFSGIFTYLRGRWSASASESIARRLRDRLYDHIQRLPCTYHDKADTGDLVQRCTSDVETFRLFLSTQVVEIGRALLMLFVPLPLMVALDVQMTLVALGTVPVIVTLAIVFFSRVRTHFKAVDEAEGRMTSALHENLTGIRVVRAFARQVHETTRFAAKVRDHRDQDYRMYRLQAWYWAASDLLCFTQIGLVVGIGAWRMSEETLSIGTFYFFMAAVNLFLWPVRMMGRMITDLGKATVAIGRIEEILAQPAENLHSSGTVARTAATGDIVTIDRGARIEFRCVSFSYAPDREMLRDVSFVVEPGKTLGILGPSGAGKSTIVRLLLRMYEPSRGAIFINHRDIASLDLAVVRNQIAIVMQEPFLYSRSLRDNLRMGSAAAEESDLVRVATMAAVHGSIMGFEAGYDTVIGERGITLSGGQRQRVAIARALLRPAPILILDDALSAVDLHTETQILGALRSRQSTQTRLIVAHRLSSVADADQILVLEHGRIVQLGRHEELMSAEGIYRRLWRIQTAEEEHLIVAQANGSTSTLTESHIADGTTHGR